MIRAEAGRGPQATGVVDHLPEVGDVRGRQRRIGTHRDEDVAHNFARVESDGAAEFIVGAIRIGIGLQRVDDEAQRDIA